VTAGQEADLNAGFLKDAQERAVRAEENSMLRDADRLKALKERDENLNIVKAAKNDGTLSQVPSEAPDTLTRARAAGGVETDETDLDERRGSGRFRVVHEG
jgi:hypothetical protein